MGGGSSPHCAAVETSTRGVPDGRDRFRSGRDEGCGLGHAVTNIYVFAGYAVSVAVEVVRVARVPLEHGLRLRPRLEVGAVVVAVRRHRWDIRTLSRLLSSV